MPKVSYNIDTYSYFLHFCPQILNGTVLDFGSNYGTFLDSSKNQFPQSQYTGVDVDESALSAGQTEFPQAQFIHYNGYNPMYNSAGTEQFPTLNDTFDTVISYSVFSHTSEEDFLFKLSKLYQHVTPGGTILVSWLDSHDRLSKLFFYKKRTKQFGKCDVIPKSDRVYLVDNCIKENADEGESLLCFYSKNYLASKLTQYDFELLSAPDPRPDGCFQSCLKINKPKL